MPGVAPTANGVPNEEQLNPDLTLFMKNMQKVDAARQIQITSPKATAQPHSNLSDNNQTERFVIELEAEGRDFHTVFKNQQVAVNQNKDLLVSSIVSNLKIRDFVINEQIISYFSIKKKNFIAVAKKPIPHDAIIPSDDIEQNGRLTLKIWSPETIPESLLMDLDCRPKPQNTTNAHHVLNMFNKESMLKVPKMDASLKSSYDATANKALNSLSSGTSYGKE